VEHANGDAGDVVEEMMAWFEERYAGYARGAAQRQPPARPPERVRHAKFGTGRVTADCGASVQVEFDDGTTRLVARSFLQPGSS
jgi:hypothetical protein